MTYDFSYIYPQMEAETRLQSSVERRLDKKLGCSCYEHAYVLPSKDLWKDGKCFGGIVTHDGIFVEASAWHEGKRCDKYEFDPASVKVDKRAVIYMGFYNSCWGHAITDNLKKLWYLNTDECRDLISQGAKLIYLTIDNQPQPNYVQRLFNLAGVDITDFELITEITQFEKIYVPDNSFIADNGQRYFTQPYIDIINSIKHSVASLSNKNNYPNKIYFTRTHIQSKRDFGEQSVENLFKKKGYVIIAPEEHSVEEQIAFLMNCSHFATTEGSISHNVVFCSKGTDVVIIRKCYDVNKYQMALNEVADANVTYIDAHNSIKTPDNAPWVGPFFMYPNKYIERFFGENCLYYRQLDPKWWLYNIQDTPLYKRIMNKIHGLTKSMSSNL